jgi:hypothetical protein
VTLLKVVSNADAGTADTVGGNDWDQLSAIVNEQNVPASYIIYKSGSTYYARNGKTNEILSSNTLGATVFQAALDALTATGGLVHFKAGTYDIATQVNVPQHPGLSYIIEGEGWRNTKINWTGGASGTAYVIESYSTNSSGWQIVKFKDLQIFGGGTTTTRLVKGLHLGRTDAAAVAQYAFDHVRIANCISPQMDLNYIQDSYWYFCHCESSSGTPTPIVDIDIKSSSHLNIYGSYFGSMVIDQSRVNMYGGTLDNIDIKAVNDYLQTFDGVFFDPMQPGTTHHIKVGTTGVCNGAIFNNIVFCCDPLVPATDRYFYINNAKNVHIRNPKFPTGHTVTNTIEFTSSCTNSYLWLQSQEDVTKVLNSSTSVQIYNPYINNQIKINNPSGTIGATVVDSHTSNQIQFANAALHLVMSLKSSSGSARLKMSTRNAANSADVTRMQFGNLGNVGLAPTVSFENMTFSGGVSIVPFVKAGIPADGDFLNPTDGMMAIDTTNSKIYVRIGGAWKATAALV